MFVGGKHAPYLRDQYKRARVLRKAGTPLKRIATAIGVSPGTVHRWTTDIEVDPDQRAAIDAAEEERWRRVVRERNQTWSRRCRRQRADHQEQGRRRAREGDALHQFGCMLYWAEGGKQRNSAAFSNSDGAMVRLYRRFLGECLGVSDSEMAVSLNFYTGNGLSVREIEDYWLELLALPRTCLRGHSVNSRPTSSSGRRTNKLPYGVCSLRVYSSRIVHRPIRHHVPPSTLESEVPPRRR